MATGSRRKGIDNINNASDSIETRESPFFQEIIDRYETLQDVTTAIRKAGVERCGLIFGIDFTLSNNIQGQKTFDGLSLHHIAENKLNPYQEVICILGETLQSFDDDGIIPAFGFGDRVVKDHGVFPLKKDGECDGFSEVLEVYNDVASRIKLAGPTNFAPLIKKAIEIVNTKKQYHILVIVADGQVSNENETIHAIVEASKYALSIIVIGVGDGPWEVMNEFDKKLPERAFDNFHFVDFHKVRSDNGNSEAAVALAALLEIPEQYRAIQTLGLLK